MSFDHAKEKRALMSLSRRRFLEQTAAAGAISTAGTVFGKTAPMGASPPPPAASRSSTVDVVIIGAGLAGLTAGRDLQRAGCESFVVLEARDRVGGRTYAHDLGHGVASEAGGQWIGPGQTAIMDLARELDVGTFPTYYQGKTVFLAGNVKVAQDFDGGVGTSGSIANKLSELSRQVPSAAPWTARDAQALDQISLGDWLAMQKPTHEEKFSFSLAGTLTFGVPPSQLSLLHYLAMINSAQCDYSVLESIKGGAQETRIAGGSQVLSIKMAEQLGGKVRLSSPVTRIEGWDQPTARIHTARGSFHAKCVVLAINPALCEQIEFDPPLPPGRKQLQQRWPAHAPMRKVAHVYPTPFWRKDGFNGQVMPLEGPLLWSVDNSPPDGSVGVLSAFVRTGYLPASPVAAEKVLTEIYVQAFGEKARHPVQFHDMDWGKVDRWSLTCINPMPPGLWTSLGTHLRPAVGRLIWSGTETADIWPGAMDGAVRSGHRAALEALAAIA